MRKRGRGTGGSWFCLVFFDSLRDGDIMPGPCGVKGPENGVQGGDVKKSGDRLFLRYLSKSHTPKNWYDAGGCAAGEDESSVKVRVCTISGTFSE